MSIQKITNAEILEKGVRALPTRPSTPSVYDGRILSAEDLKAAFDRLPTLIAERFNALLESTGLFDVENPRDSFAELVATELFASHSLKNFFEDVRSGNLALYLTADAEGNSLTDVIAQLKQAIESKKSYTVSIEGDGDLLSDAALNGDELTLTRGARTEDILGEAKAYADAPMGTVTENCSLPVSGDKVFRITEAQEKRIESLECAGKDILYTYPVAEESFAYNTVTDDVLPCAALLRMGASPLSRLNYFPEVILSTYANDHLSITWDEEAGQLVINGTLLASESPLTVAPFKKWLPCEFFSIGLFYHGGSVSTQEASLCLCREGDQYSTVSFLEEDSFVPYDRFITGNQMETIQLRTTEDTVFDNYRFNLIISREQSFIRYEPFISKYGFSIPKNLVALGPNIWMGEKEIRGTGYASFDPCIPRNVGTCLIGVKAETTAGIEGILSLEIYAENGTHQRKRAPISKYGCFLVVNEAPVTEVRVYATNSSSTAKDYSVTVTDIYVSPVVPSHDNIGEYVPSHRDDIVFPDSFSRFSERYLGFGTDKCNYFDLEAGAFYELVKSFTVDGSLNFVPDESDAGRFSAPFSLPSDCKSDFAYQPSCLFTAGAPGDEALWFASGRVYVQSALFAGKDASEVKRILRLCPIDVIYETESVQKISLDQEEKAFCETAALRVVKDCYVYFCDENGEPVDTYSHIQYQIKK